MNKKEIKHFLLVTRIILLIAIIFICIYSYSSYKKLEKNNNLLISSILYNVKQQYPDLNDEEIIHILNTDELNEYPELKKYGIKIEESNISLSNKKLMLKYIECSMLVLFIYLIITSFVFNIFFHKREKNLKEITNYLKEINNHNYSLKMEDNEEGELSILKNELYKTSIMLNEQASLSKKEKENLKDSLSDISHQLRTPLTSINLMIDNILEGNLSKEEERKQLLSINRKIKSTNFLIESLLKLSKFDANTIEFNNSNYKINKITENVENSLRDLLDLNDITLNITGNKKDTLYCDYHWLVEALTNIVKNCIEHSKPGSSIDINYSQSELLTKITIKDYGTGMNEKDRKHLFDRFYKGENSNPNSIGIGMSLAKAIIEHNGGTISVSSKIGKGSEFTIKYLHKK